MALQAMDKMLARFVVAGLLFAAAALPLAAEEKAAQGVFDFADAAAARRAWKPMAGSPEVSVLAEPGGT